MANSERRRRDEGTAATVSFVIAASVFALSLAVIFPMMYEPTSSMTNAPLDDAQLDATAQTALDLLMRAEGAPSAWATSASSIDAVTRLGLGERGSAAKLDTQKFSALTRGSLNAGSATNGYVDYQEAKNALGIQGFDFHLRLAPAFDPSDGAYGAASVSDLRVAYVGNSTTMLSQSTAEQAQLARLPFSFDVYSDSPAALRADLLPKLGASFSQSTIAPGAGAADFALVGPDSYSHLLSSESNLTRAVALLNYSAGREIRASLGAIDLSQATSASLTWQERVHTSVDANDYGWLEVSPDLGATWMPITNALGERSTDTGLATNLWTPRAATIQIANCAACIGNDHVLVALHWTADGDAQTGDGWVVDDVTLTNQTLQTVAQWPFEEPEYDVLILGSNVDAAALRAADVSLAAANFVREHEGHLIALGGQTDASWLAPTLRAGARDAPAVALPADPSHPLLDTPNVLAWSAYPALGSSWDVPAPENALFVPATAHLAASVLGAFGGNGSVVLSSYLPAQLAEEEGAAFFANMITYSKYVSLYADVGPAIPSGVPISAASRTAVIDRSLGEGAEYVDMKATLFLWRGDETYEITPGAASGATPAPPRSLTAAGSAGRVDLSWSEPLSGTPTGYVIYRGSAAGEQALFATIGANTTFTDFAVTNGTTYAYNVTAWSANGPSSTSNDATATPSSTSSAPVLGALPGLGQISLSWTAPATSGGSVVTSYNVYRGASPGTETWLATMGGNLSFVDADLPDGATRYYRVAGVNAAGVGTWSNEVSATTLGAPGAPLALIATGGSNQISLSWSAPLTNGGSPVTGYKIHRGTTSGGETLLATIGTNTSFVDAGLAANATRYYQVTAITAVGEGAASNEASATTHGPPWAPTLVIAVTGSGSGRINVNFAAPLYDGGSPVTSYKVYRSLVPGAEVYLGTTTTPPWEDSGLLPLTVYYYKLTAVSAGGESALSPETFAVSSS